MTTRSDGREDTYTDDELYSMWRGLNGAKRERLRWIRREGQVAWRSANRQHAMLRERGLVRLVQDLIVEQPRAALTPMAHAMLKIAEEREAS